LRRGLAGVEAGEPNFCGWRAVEGAAPQLWSRLVSASAWRRCLTRLRAISELMRSARLIDRRIMVWADGATTFVQARGDFVIAAGRPYQNVYVFRFDWRDGKIVSWGNTPTR